MGEVSGPVSPGTVTEPSNLVASTLCVIGSTPEVLSSAGRSTASEMLTAVAAGNVRPPGGVYPWNKCADDSFSSFLNHPVAYCCTNVGSVLVENSYVKSPVNIP